MIAIIKYKAGNVQSVQNALNRLNVDNIVTDDIDEIKKASKVIFPGVGNAAAAMEDLKEKRLDTVIKNLTKPVLGICVGMQLLCKHSEEGNTKCLGVFDTEIKLFKANDAKLLSKNKNLKYKVPQIGWNNIYNYNSVLFKGLTENDFVYFVHSYYAAACKDAVANTNYILEYSAALQKNNFYAVQFHPEKSGEVGETILKNFIELS